MHSDLVEFGWTEEQWNRIGQVVAEEAQKARVGARVLPVVGNVDPSATAVPSFRVQRSANRNPPPDQRLAVDSDPTLPLTTLAINVPLRSQEMSDPALNAALAMFRRAANYVARLEDTLVFNGIPFPAGAADGIPPVFDVSNDHAASGIVAGPLPLARLFQPIAAAGPGPGAPITGNDVVNAVIAAINRAERAGQLGPYACILSHALFELVCSPTDAMVLPRDRLLPFLEGPLLRCSQIASPWGCVIALSGNPLEIVVSSDIKVRFLQATLEPRYVFRVSERVALRIKEPEAIVILR